MRTSSPKSPPSLDEEISRFLHRLLPIARPERVILFGSWAYGRPSRSSDVDLCLIVRHPSRRGIVRALYSLDRTFALDLVIFTESQVRWRLREGDFFLREILEKGTVLYEAPHSRVG